MNNKRFKVTNISENGMTGLFWLGKDNLSVYDIVKLLNDLVEENEHLKQSFNEVLKSLEVTTFDKELLEKENEELKSDMRDNYKKHKELLDENEQLRHQIETYKTGNAILKRTLEKLLTEDKE